MGTRRNHVPQAGVEADQSNGVPLPEQQQRHRRGQPFGVGQLGQSRRVASPLHGGRNVEHEHGPGIGLFLELFDDPAIGAPCDAPIEITQVITRHVGAMLRELNRKPLSGRPMETGNEAVHHPTGHQFQMAQRRQDGRVELVGTGWLMTQGYAQVTDFAAVL